MSDQPKEYFLIDVNGSYWGPDRGGYSFDVVGAGLYTEAGYELRQALTGSVVAGDRVQA